MKYTIELTSRFKKDIKRIQKRNYELESLRKIIKLLAEGKELPAKFKDHTLKGKYSSCRECHISPDWLLIYEYDNDVLYLYLVRTGSHSDLFDM